MRLRAAMAALLLLSGPVTARPWKPKDTVLAQEYSVITDTRPNHDLIEVFWMTWPMGTDQSPMLQQLLDKYVILGVAHGQLDPGGKMIFSLDESVQAIGLSGTQLKALDETGYPPMVAGMVATLGGFVRQSLGAMGQGTKFYVFDSAGVRACEKGQLSVVYAGETYTYETPIPGCPKP
jgi:hypothetical protein